MCHVSFERNGYDSTHLPAVIVMVNNMYAVTHTDVITLYFRFLAHPPISIPAPSDHLGFPQFLDYCCGLPESRIFPRHAMTIIVNQTFYHRSTSGP